MHWKEHFEELLNLTNTHSMMEAEPEVDGGSSSISLVEVTEVVKHLQPIVKPQIEEEQCGFRPRTWNYGPLFTLARILEGVCPSGLHVFC